MPILQFKWTSRNRKTGSYMIHLPKQIIENVLMWKQGDKIKVVFIEYKGKKGLFLYKED